MFVWLKEILSNYSQLYSTSSRFERAQANIGAFIFIQFKVPDRRSSAEAYNVQSWH